MRLFEIFDKSYVDEVRWQNYKGGWWGSFDLEGLRFTIDIKYESLDDMKDKYNLSGKYLELEEILGDKLILRIDYNQVVDGEYRIDNVNNAKEIAIKVLSTVATETSQKIKGEKFDVIYFAAKEHDDGSKNQRLTLYPKIGRSMAQKLRMICLSDSSESSASFTVLVKNLTPEEVGKFREILEK